MQMKRKLLLMLASFSIVVLVTMPAADIASKPILQMIQTMGHGAGG